MTTLNKKLLPAIAMAVALLASTQVSAATYSFSNVTSNGTSSQINDPEATLSMVTASSGNTMSFTFYNNNTGTPDTGSISEIYFGPGSLASFFSNIGLTDSDGSGTNVEFAVGGSPENMPGDGSLSIVAGSTSPEVAHGIDNNGEWLTITMQLINGYTYASITDLLNAGTLQVGLHVKSIGSGSESNTYRTTTSVVPVPAAAWLFGSALLGLTGVSRRKKTNAAVVEA